MIGIPEAVLAFAHPYAILFSRLCLPTPSLSDVATYQSRTNIESSSVPMPRRQERPKETAA